MQKRISSEDEFHEYLRVEKNSDGDPEITNIFKEMQHINSDSDSNITCNNVLQDCEQFTQTIFSECKQSATTIIFSVLNFASKQIEYCMSKDKRKDNEDHVIDNYTSKRLGM